MRVSGRARGRDRSPVRAPERGAAASPARSDPATSSCRSPMRDVVAAEADADVLRLEEDLVAPGPALAAGARGLGAAERLAQVAHVLAVDEAHAGLDGRRDAVRAPEVLGPDVAR